MLVLVSYDVMTSSKGGQRRLRRVAKTCVDFGQRVQCSVFECTVDPAQWVQLRQKLIKEIDQNKDSLRFYFLGANGKSKIEHIGAKEITNLDEPLVI